MDWQAFGSAVALVLVIEGLLPFVNPQAARRAGAAMAMAKPGFLRIMGLLSIVGGLGLLAIVRSAA